ncbi:MAG TPA: phosphoglycerate dehydrogenase [Thermomicrobiales bacterium]|nr:phosphoglycerate dehydrogenase [Thermomicrobiales bacterium]
MTYRVLLTTPKFREDEAFARQYLREHDCVPIEHDRHGARLGEDELCELVRDADGWVTHLETVTERVFAAAPRLKVISAGGVGYDHIDVAAASRHGVAVCICAGCNNHAVSELALGLMLGLARRIATADRAIREGGWPRLVGPELWGKTLGIVGLGRVGKSLALIGRGLGMRVLATDVVWDITFANEHQISYVSLPRLLGEADFVSLHCPLTPQTRGLINDATLAQMKPTAYLINTARGPIVDEAALVRALRERRIAGAGLDVFETEPRPNNPFVEFENVLLTSHLGGATHEAVERSLQLALLNVTQVLTGGPPVCQVNEREVTLGR